METIKPRQAEIDAEGDDPAQADPVHIVRREGPPDNCIVEIECENGDHHRLTIKGEHVTIHDHTSECIERQQIEADFI